MSPTPPNNKVGKDRRDQKVDKRKANEQLKKIQEESRKLEKEKQDYETQKAEEVKKINEVKAQLDAGAEELRGQYEELLQKKNDGHDEAANWDKKLQENKGKERELQSMDWGDGDGDSGGETVTPLGTEDPEDLFTLAQMMREMGVSDDEAVVGWRSIGKGSEQYLVQYGPQNAANFVLKRPSTVIAGIDKDVAKDIGDPRNRFGEQRTDDKKHVYLTRHFRAIQGVAWVQYGSDDPTYVLRPKEKGEERRFPTVYVRIKWEVDGEFKKSWEVRATVQRIFGSNKSVGDKAIYMAAKHQMKRHQEWVDGERKGKEASPTPDPELEKLIQTQEDAEVNNESTNGVKPPPSGEDGVKPPPSGEDGVKPPPSGEDGVKPPPSGEPVGKTAYQLFKNEWCEAHELDPGSLDDAAKTKCFEAFQKSKA